MKRDNIAMWIKNSSLEVAVLFFENTTTHVVHIEEGHLESMKTFEVSQILQGQLVLRIPKVACVLGHQLDLMIQARTPKDDWTFRSRAKVLKYEALDDNDAEVLVDLHNKSDIAYTRFLEVFEDLQDQVTELFLAIKGN